jgi:RNA polymerase sigma factor (sigma-70 family)
MDQSFPQRDFPREPEHTRFQRHADRGEQRAILDELYRDMQGQLYAQAYASLRDAHLARDHVQEVFLKMYVGFESLVAHQSARAWIITASKNELVDRYRENKRKGFDLPADFEQLLERDLAERSWTNRFEERVDRWVSIIEPVIVYLRTIVAKGWLRETDLDAYWHGAVAGVTQRELADRSGLTQGRISQRRSDVTHHVRAAFYFCEILGIVRPPHHEAEIRSHLDLVDLAASLTAEDRVLLRRAGDAVRLDPLYQPVLSPKDATAAIQDREAGRVIELHELHDAESRYAAAIPNPTPHCIESPCAVHTASPQMTKAEDDE